MNKTTRKGMLQMGLKYMTMLIVCLMSVVACTKDSSIPEAPNVETTETTTPIDDQVSVKSPMLAYISPNVPQDGFGRALRNRLTNRITTLEEYELLPITMVIHNNDIHSFPDQVDLYATLFTQLLIGRNVIIVEPTAEGILNFSTGMTEVFDFFVSTPEGREVLEEIEHEAVPGARLVFEALHEISKDDSKIESLFAMSSDDEGILAEAFAIRGSTFNIVERMSNKSNNDVTTNEVMDDNGDLSTIEDFEEVANIGTATDIKVSAYSYGLFADMLTKWINDHKYYMDEYETRSERALLDIQAASEQRLSLDDIANVQRVEYTMRANIPFDISPVSIPVVIRYEVCSVYVEKEDSDYYCVYKTIRSYNQFLNCGPENIKEWKEHCNFYYDHTYNAEGKPVFFVPFYGPFMRAISGKSLCYAASENINTSSDKVITLPNANDIPTLSGVSVMEYAPKNSAGNTTLQCGINFGFNGGLSFSNNPASSIGASFSYSKTTTQTIEDITITASTQSGVPSWNYEGGNLPQTHWGAFTDSHDIAPSIMREECEVNQSWIWRVQNPSGSYNLYDETSITLCVLSYNDSLFATQEVYNNRKTTSQVSFLMLPPPRYEQRWIRDVQPYSEEVNKLLGTLHSKYWNPDDYEMLLPDSSEDSTLSINQFITDFKTDLEDKRMIWHNRGLVPEGNKYTFYFYKKGSSIMETLEFEL